MSRRSPRLVLTLLRMALAQRLPDKTVRRTIHGVGMWLPRRHLLPFFTGPGSQYGINLVRLGELLAGEEDGLCLLDVGANVGDSTLTVLARANGSAVCVEPDPEWLRYLHLNVDSLDNVAIESSVLLPPGAETQVAIVHEDAGSSRLERVEAAESPAAITTDELLERHPQLKQVRLIKTDTDGYDVMLTPALAETFARSRPVIFLEFDPYATSIAMPELDAAQLWPTLHDLGYERALVWANTGELIGPARTLDLVARMADFDKDEKERGFTFWDVAVAHRSDPIGLRILESAAG